MHGDVDCVNNGLVPTISLLAASPDWVVVSRLSVSPLSIVARNGSKINKLADLKGKSIAVPFGGGSHPYVIRRLEEAGLQTGEGADKVRLLNLRPSEQAIAMQQGSVDAVGTWEPQTAIMIQKGLGKVIETEKHLAVVTVRKSIATKDPASIVKLLKCYIEANYYVARHEVQAYKWFAAQAHIDDDLIRTIKVIEPNTKAKTTKDINIDLSAQDLALGQRYADTMLKAELIPTAVDFKSRADLSFLQEAKKELAAEGFKNNLVRETKYADSQ
jgi:taurine transport system substrate-binding protein